MCGSRLRKSTNVVPASHWESNAPTVKLFTTGWHAICTSLVCILPVSALLPVLLLICRGLTLTHLGASDSECHDLLAMNWLLLLAKSSYLWLTQFDHEKMSSADGLTWWPWTGSLITVTVEFHPQASRPPYVISSRGIPQCSFFFFPGPVYLK